eukprot:EG_transcript_13295
MPMTCLSCESRAAVRWRRDPPVADELSHGNTLARQQDRGVAGRLLTTTPLVLPPCLPPLPASAAPVAWPSVAATAATSVDIPTTAVLLLLLLLLSFGSAAVLWRRARHSLRRSPSPPVLSRGRWPVLPPVRFPAAAAAPDPPPGVPLLTWVGDCVVRSWRSDDAVQVAYLVERVQGGRGRGPNPEGDEVECLYADQTYTALGGEFLVAETEGRVIACAALSLSGPPSVSSSKLPSEGEPAKKGGPPSRVLATLKRVCLDPQHASQPGATDLLLFMMGVLLHVARARGATEVAAVAYPESVFAGTQPTPEMLYQLGFSFDSLLPNSTAARFRAAVAGPGSVLLRRDVAAALSDFVAVVGLDGSVLGHYPEKVARQQRMTFK